MLPFHRESPIVTTAEGARPGLEPETIARAEELLRDACRDVNALSAADGKGVVREFEERFAELVGARYAVSTSSGTTALIGALAACGVGAGDEVIVCTYGWGGTAGAVLALGAEPVFADMDPERLSLDAASVEEQCGRRTRVILATHLFGIPADVNGLRRVADARQIPLIFDAAQALGASPEGRPVGSWGDVSVFSFGRGKLLSTGEGGMAVTSDPAIRDRIVMATQHPVRALRQLRDRRLRGFIDETGLSCRMHPLAAAIGTPQLALVPERLERRTSTTMALVRRIQEIPGFRVPGAEVLKDAAFHRFPLTYSAEELGGIPRSRVLETLRGLGVPAVAGPVRTPIHQRPRFQREFPGRDAAFPFRNRGRRHAQHRRAEERCTSQEALLESSSDWLAVPSERVDQIAAALETVSESFRRTHHRIPEDDRTDHFVPSDERWMANRSSAQPR